MYVYAYMLNVAIKIADCVALVSTHIHKRIGACICLDVYTYICMYIQIC